MVEARQQALRVGFDAVINVEFHGARVSSDAGLFAFRDIDEVVILTAWGMLRSWICSGHMTPGLELNELIESLAGLPDSEGRKLRSK